MITSTVRPLSFAEIMGDPAYDSLIFEYAAECCIPEIGPINPQPETYAALENAGVMQAFGAFNGEELAGFATVLVSVLPHYGQKVATLESLFVAKEFRCTGAGIDLMDMVETYAKEMGCAGILYSAPSGGQLEKVLARCGKYRRTNAVFYRSLG